MKRAAVLTTLLCTAIPLAIPLGAVGDVVLLNDGERVEGIATERGDEVDVRLDFGTITFSKSEIKSIEKQPGKLEAYEARAAKLAERDVEGRYRLGIEVEKAGFGAYARALFRQVIDVNADHKGARAALGYKRHGDVWLTEDEYMTQQGYVKMGGGWITQEAAANIEKVETERRAILEEARRRDEDSARIRALEAEVEAVRREAALGQGVVESAGGWWLPYWTGHGFSHKRQTGAGFGLSVGVSGSGARGEIKVGAPSRGLGKQLTPAPGATRSLPVAPPAATAAPSGRAR